MSDFNPKDCPVGIANDNKIERVGDRLDMAIQRIEEKITDLKEDVNKGFSDMNNKLDNLEDRFNQFEETVDSKIDKRIKENTANKVMTVLKWIIFTAGGSILIAVLTRMILAALKLN